MRRRIRAFIAAHPGTNSYLIAQALKLDRKTVSRTCSRDAHLRVSKIHGVATYFPSDPVNP